MTQGCAQFTKMEKDFAKKPGLKAMLDPKLKYDETKARYEELKKRNVLEQGPVDLTELEEQRLKITEALKQLQKAK